MTKDETLAPEDKLATLLRMDSILGLNLLELDDAAKKLAQTQIHVALGFEDIPETVQKLVREREEARASKNWERADELRNKIASEGYSIEDSGASSRIFKL